MPARRSAAPTWSCSWVRPTPTPPSPRPSRRISRTISSCSPRPDTRCCSFRTRCAPRAAACPPSATPPRCPISRARAVRPRCASCRRRAIWCSRRSRATAPPSSPSAFARSIRRLRPGANLLETVFPYTNAIHHPPAILCNAGRVEATGGDYYHYYDGISPAVGRLIDALDRERLAVAERARRARAALRRAVLSRRLHHGGRARSPASPTRRFTRASRIAGSGRRPRWTTASSTRIFPTGWCCCRELGRLAGVATPTMDHVDPARLRGDRQGLPRAGSDARSPRARRSRSPPARSRCSTTAM